MVKIWFIDLNNTANFFYKNKKLSRHGYLLLLLKMAKIKPCERKWKVFSKYS